MVSLAYDDVEKRPELCRYLLQMLFNRYQAWQQPIERPVLVEKEIIRLALSSAHPISPKEVCLHFDMNHRTAMRLLRSLCAKGWLRPIPSGAGQRIHRYELLRERWEMVD